ncbi:MAG: hypothetical protein ACO22Z_03885, partial [Paracoccaceae bacterium]
MYDRAGLAAAGSAAGLATREVLREPGVYDRACATGRRLIEAFTGMIQAAGLPARIVGMPVLFDLMFLEGEVANYRDTLRQDMDALGYRSAALEAA